MPSLDEKRGIQNHQILKAGTISFDGSGIDCLVRKMSGYGANLEVESQIGIPNSFDLVIDTEHSNHHCRVVWRKAVGLVSRSIRKSRRWGLIRNGFHALDQPVVELGLKAKGK
jgi:hypothetical protein